MAVPARATLTYAQILRIALDAGFAADGSGTVIGDSAHTITAIALAESGGDTQAQSPVTVREDSRGLLQINLKAHGDRVSVDCAYTPACAMSFAYALSLGGRKFTDWSVFKSGAYQSKLQLKTLPDAVSVGGDPRTGGGGVGSVEPVTAGGSFLGIDTAEWRNFGIAFAVAAAATGLVILGAVGIVTGSDAGKVAVRVASKGLAG